MKEIDVRNTIAIRASQLLEENTVVNLGIGIPTFIVNHISKDKNIIFQTENGILGLGRMAEAGEEDDDIFDSGSNHVTIEAGGTYFSSDLSFGLIRGGHVNTTILGALQVDEKGNLANWIIPGKMVPSFGGAMDLIAGVATVIVTMEHTNKGSPKILKECTFPLTGVNCVDYIITEMGLMQITTEGIVLKEVAEGYTVEDVQGATEAKLILPQEIGSMKVYYL